jgi:hypothetical protein
MSGAVQEEKSSRIEQALEMKALCPFKTLVTIYPMTTVVLYHVRLTSSLKLLPCFLYLNKIWGK